MQAAAAPFVAATAASSAAPPRQGRARAAVSASAAAEPAVAACAVAPRAAADAACASSQADELHRRCGQAPSPRRRRRRQRSHWGAPRILAALILAKDHPKGTVCRVRSVSRFGGAQLTRFTAEGSDHAEIPDLGVVVRWSIEWFKWLRDDMLTIGSWVKTRDVTGLRRVES